MTLARRLRAAWRLARAVVHGLHGLAVVLWRFPWLDAAGRHARIAWWAAGMLRALGLRLDVQGTFRPAAKLIVANHVSWLDIMAIHAVCPQARFVSKADVRHWPLVNRLVDAAGTLYLEREKRRDALRVVHQMADALAAGQTVAVFPEGTTSDGHGLLPFHANLLQAAIATATPVQPVALRYADATHAVSPAAEFTGDTTLAQSLWRLACGEQLTVHVRVLPATGSAHADRRALAELVRQSIAEALAPHLAEPTPTATACAEPR
ncbi:lysophospholipid acyltransferase family protein [Calidifontimicrobium sp. SYSU G02091]|uniref:lysophospholipid acyltransferase family protein n=1 Tax=Calidifontimicrobium sp. SYSU G02091 TaxID=2926421 RepID=UPI003FA467C3